MGDRFDLKLIPEFNGSTPVLDWVEKVELHCLLSGVKSIEHVIPLRLSGGAFAVYQQLSVEEKQSYEKIKAALYKAFAIDPATAWEQFEARALHPGETVDVYLAELTKPPNSRCTSSFRRGQITGIVSELAVLVDGTPRHVRDIRPALNKNPLASSGSGESSNDELWIRPMPPRA